VGPWNHVLDEGPVPQGERQIWGFEKHWESAAMYTKMDEPIKMPFGEQTRMGQTNHVLDDG